MELMEERGSQPSLRSLCHDHHSPHLHHDHNDQDHQHHHDGQPAGDDLKFDLEKSGEQSPMNRVIEHLPHLPNIITSSSSSSSSSRSPQDHHHQHHHHYHRHHQQRPWQCTDHRQATHLENASENWSSIKEFLTVK